MSFTNEDYLPSFEELDVPDLQVTSSILRASGVYFGKYCDNISKEFMLCVKEEQDPRKCINEGKEVTRCGFDFYRKLKKNCQEEFNTYHECIDKAGYAMELYRCRPTQRVFDSCMLEKMGMERPPIGYFTRARIHHTERPKPRLKDHELPDTLPELGDPSLLPDPKQKNIPPYPLFV